MAAKRERELARIVDRDFKGRNGGNLFDSGAAVFFDGVGTVMDVVVGDGAVLFDGVGKREGDGLKFEARGSNGSKGTGK